MYLAWDTETTGLSSKNQVLTSYFIILDEEYNEVDKLDLRIKYDEYVINPRAMDVNKIDMVEHEKIAITVGAAQKQLEFFLENNRVSGKYVPLGHNIKFDLRMLRSSNILTEDIDFNYISSDFVDTIDMVRELKKCNKIEKTQSASLGKICKYFDIQLESDKLHDAEYDIKLTIELYKYIKNTFR